MLSAWLGREVRLVASDPTTAVSYEMTFDPPDDDAEYFAIETRRAPTSTSPPRTS